MIKLFKQARCKHEYHVVKTFIKDGDNGVGYKPVEYAVLYCPACKKEDTVTMFKYEMMKEIKRVEEEYAEQLEKLKRQDNS